MPKLNLRDEGETRPLEEDSSFGAPPTLRDFGGGSGGGVSTLVKVLGGVLILAAGVFALNYFGVIHLWGKRPAVPAQMVQETPQTPLIEEIPLEQTPTPTPTPTPTITSPPAASKTGQKPPVEKPVPQVVPMGSGSYTVQVSAWLSRAKADEESSKLSGAGFPSFVEEGMFSGEAWYQVRVGRYTTRKEADDERAKLQNMLEGSPFVIKVSS
jgi:cell division septation protein DedD